MVTTTHHLTWPKPDFPLLMQHLHGVEAQIQLILNLDIPAMFQEVITCLDELLDHFNGFSACLDVLSVHM
jgi:hypothetical protein